MISKSAVYSVFNSSVSLVVIAICLYLYVVDSDHRIQHIDTRIVGLRVFSVDMCELAIPYLPPGLWFFL